VMEADLSYILRRTGLEQEVKIIVLTCSNLYRDQCSSRHKTLEISSNLPTTIRDEKIVVPTVPFQVLKAASERSLLSHYGFSIMADSFKRTLGY
jgi:hypothetical protein